jgi:two-component system chemotaxis sensor kinase CheA
MPTDPYKYFRVEARELLEGLTQGALDIEKGVADRAVVGSLLRLAHTLKGASRVVKQPAMAELAHGVEEILSPFRDTEPSLPKTSVRQILHLLDEIGVGVAALDQVSDSAASAKRTVSEEQQETVRVDIEELEGVLSSLSEAAVLLTKVQSEAGALTHARRLAEQLVQHASLSGKTSEATVRGKIHPLAEELSSSLEHLGRRLASAIDEMQREIAITRDRAFQLRLLPARSIFSSLLRAVHDASTILGKQAQLETSGGEIRLEAQVLMAMRDAILQLVRNAVAHGLETRQFAPRPAKRHWVKFA